MNYDALNGARVTIYVVHWTTPHGMKVEHSFESRDEALEFKHALAMQGNVCMWIEVL